MPKNHEIFLKHIENIFGPAETIKKHDCPRGGIPVSVFIYRDIPDKGMVASKVIMAGYGEVRRIKVYKPRR